MLNSRYNSSIHTHSWFDPSVICVKTYLEILFTSEFHNVCLRLRAKSLNCPFISREAARKEVIELSERYGLHVDPEAFVEDLPVGLQQRIEILKALRKDIDLLILDEPTEGIQPSIIQDIGKCLRKLVDDMGITVLLVEQYYDFAKELSDNYIVMRRGEVIAQGKGVDMDKNGVQEMISV